MSIVIDRRESRLHPRKMAEWAMDLYRWYFDFTCEHGYQPSFIEAGADLGLTRSRFGLGLVIAERCGWAVSDPDLPYRKLRFRFTPEGRAFMGFEPRRAS